MLKHHSNNVRIKHQYFIFLRDAKRLSEHSIDGVAKALARFEEHTSYKDFKTFRHEQASSFKRYLIDKNALGKDTKLSKSTIHSTFTALKRFFEWLAIQPGYKFKIQYSDAEYFNTSNKDIQIATTKRPQKAPTLEQIKHVIDMMPSSTDIEQRNRALIAFTILTGARDSAIYSAKLKHINLEGECFEQDARDVKTKFSKTFTTFFFPVGDECKQVVIDWVKYLKSAKLYGDDDPLFPMNEIGINDNQQFTSIGIKPTQWSTAAPIRGIFKKAFKDAGLSYFNPHSFRNTLAKLAQISCKTPEEFKAWSQNLGHENVLTTFLSYGQVGMGRQEELLKNLGGPDHGVKKDKELALEIAQALITSGFSIKNNR